MTDAIVKAEAVTGTAQMLDVALRAAGTLKSARGLLPDSLKTEGDIVAVLLAGAELGLGPMAAIRGLQVVRGKVIISYDTMIALLRRASYRIEWMESTSTRAVLKLTAPDGSTHVETWDQDRAKRAGIWGKGTWSQYPETMLKARCVSSAARSFAGDVLAGVYVEGEIENRPAPIVQLEPKPDAVPPQRVAETSDGEIAEVRATFAECETAAELEVFCRDKRDALSALRNGQRKTATAKCREAAERCGVEAGVALGWAGLAEESQS